jgi:hypothetical protein
MAEPGKKVTGEENLRDKSMPELVGDLIIEITDLVREEIAMAKAELSEKIGAAGRGAGYLSGSMVAGLMALGSATALAIIALALVVDAWLAAAIVTGSWILLAAILFLTGTRQVKEAVPPVPQKTVQTLKEDAKWARHPTRSKTK